ncbi:hypothetical protein HDV06_004465 [Boothiomyces sp. JEL0866]|nr:hypothetical protein HDV06_004465 [Boothiomyces sp. JEL0866]
MPNLDQNDTELDISADDYEVIVIQAPTDGLQEREKETIEDESSSQNNSEPVNESTVQQINYVKRFKIGPWHYPEVYCDLEDQDKKYFILALSFALIQELMGIPILSVTWEKVSTQVQLVGLCYLKVSLSFLFIFVIAVILILGITTGDMVWESPVTNYVLIGIMIFVLIWPVLIIVSATIAIVIGIILSPLLVFEDIRMLVYYTLFEDASRGASSQLIRKLPVYQFKTDKEDDCDKKSWFKRQKKFDNLELEADACCSICLCDYQHNEFLRQLNCAHHFHKKCLDEWLRLNAKCPLCVQELQ